MILPLFLLEELVYTRRYLLGQYPVAQYYMLPVSCFLMLFLLQPDILDGLLQYIQRQP